jgi:hypothetical protein
MASYFIDPHGHVIWFSVLLVAFSVVFCAVGIYRAVEFLGLGLRPLPRRLLIASHVLGCVLFSVALAWTGLDQRQLHKPEITRIFFTGLALLLPVQIYIGIKRRILLRDRKS